MANLKPFVKVHLYTYCARMNFSPKRIYIFSIYYIINVYKKYNIRRTTLSVNTL